MSFGVALNCIDGRVQVSVIEFLRAYADIEYVDMITEPGMDGVLAERQKPQLLQSIKDKLFLSLNRHRAQIVAVCGHYDCAGNPVSQDKHKEHIRKGAELVHSWGVKVPVVGLWIDEHWRAHLIFRTG